MTAYLVIIEPAGDGTGFGAYVPDLPGCVAVGDTVDQVEERIRGAIEFHIRGLREDGIDVPAPSTILREVEVSK